MLFYDKEQSKLEQKLIREQKKLGLPNYVIDETKPIQKSQKHRLKMRNKEQKRNKKDIEKVDYQTRELERYKQNTAFGKRIKEDYIYGNEKIKNILEVNQEPLITIMENNLYEAQRQKMKMLTQLTLKMVMFQHDDDDEPNEIDVYANTSVKNISNKQDIKNLIEELYDEIEIAIGNLKGSFWVFGRYKKLTVRIGKQTNKVYAGSFIELSPEIKGSQGCVNIKNMDNKCLEYCLIRFTYQNQIKSKNTSNPSIYNKYFKFIKVPENQVYPIDIEEDIPKYEVLNDVKIIVYVIKNKQFLQFFKSDYISKDKRTMNLLLIEENDNHHFCLINNISRLMNHLSKDKKHKTFICDNCNNYNTQKLEKLEEHQTICLKNEQTFVKLPIKNKDDIMKFKNHQNEFQHPFSCFVDFESTLEKIEEKKENIEYYQKHIPNSFGIKYDCIHNQYSENYKEYINKDDKQLCKDFVKELERLAQKSYNISIQNKNNINWTAKQNKNHKDNKKCNRCFNEYTKKNYKVRHHDHITGDFIDSICNNCNTLLRYKKFLPVYIHNLKGYDSHLFIQALYDNKNDENDQIKCIPNSEEKYISFSKNIKVDEYYDYKTIYYEIRFIDSYAILSGSLNSLVENIKKDCKNTIDLRRMFKNTSKEFSNNEDFELMTQKGVYPYDYIDNFNRLYEKKLPSKKHFYSKLNETDIEDNQYETAKKVYNHFKCNNIMDYHKLYLKADVLLLSDIWNNFKNVCLTNYKLDPTYYLTAPSLSWDAFLKVSKIELELISDYEMYLFIEQSIRGGLSQISKRYAKANNKYMDDYNKEKPETYISYFDANNLYGWSMCNYLPYKDFKWNMDEWNKEKILNIGDEDETGYLFNVDLNIPENKHDYFNNYTPLPENKIVKETDLNKHQRIDYEKSKFKKLCCSLENKKGYTVNYRLLKLVLSLGFELTEAAE